MIEPRPIEVSPELEQRIRESTWTIYVCAELDGEHCEMGTHPNILTHNCAAIVRFHESEGIQPGPVVIGVPVRFDESLLPEEYR